MKLNQECIRDLMLFLEDNLVANDDFIIDNCNDPVLAKYSIDDLHYTAEKLSEAGYLNIEYESWVLTSNPLICVKSITYSGHQFLDTIRDDKIWAKTKGILSNLKVLSIEIISETASKVITNLIN